MMLCHVLGPIRVEVEGTVVDVGGAVPRRFLAALALGDGRPVPDTRVAELVWGDDPPAAIHKSLPVVASRLRTALGPDARHHLDRAPAGYVLTASSDHGRFAHLVASGRQHLVDGHAAAAEEALRTALGFWRGDPYADLGDAAAVVGPRTQLAELRAVAVEELHAARLATGDAAMVVAGLHEAVAEAPYRERRWELLALALYRCGRQADALAELRRVRELLVDELGIEPGPALRGLETRVLEQDPNLSVTGTDPTPVRPPARLLTPRVLVGRSTDLAAVDDLVTRAAAGVGGVVVVHGPRGSGRSAMTDAAADLARRRGLPVLRASQVRTKPALSAWSQVLRDAGCSDDLTTALLTDPPTDGFDAAAQRLIAGPPRLIIVDDLDHGGPQSVAVLSAFAGRAAAGSTAALVTSTGAVGVGRELALRGLTVEDLARVVDPGNRLTPELVTALRVASGGRPGVALELVADLPAVPADDDAIVHLAVATVSGTDFLVVDDAVLQLLEMALPRARDAISRARVLARLARELLGDPSAASRRASLAAEALALARAAGDRRILAEILDSQLHAVWEPDGTRERLDSGAEITALARAVGDDELERRGLFWTFTALIELGRIAEAEVVLAAFERSALAATDLAALTMVAARHGMLALVRGRFDEIPSHVADVLELGRRGGVADTDRLNDTLRGQLAKERDPSGLGQAISALRSTARRLPGHFMGASAAYLLAVQGQTSEANAEMRRVLPDVLAGTGPRWVGAVASLSFAAAATGDADAGQRLYAALSPHRGRIVALGGANSLWGTVSYYLGLLDGLLGRRRDAVKHFEESLALELEIGALPWQAHTMVALAELLDGDGDLDDGVRAAGLRARAASIAEQIGMTVLLNRLAGGPPLA